MIQEMYIYTLHRNYGVQLCLRVADNLTQVVARHCEGITVAVAELGAADLRVCHTLVVQMCNLKGDWKNTL